MNEYKLVVELEFRMTFLPCGGPLLLPMESIIPMLSSSLSKPKQHFTRSCSEMASAMFHDAQIMPPLYVAARMQVPRVMGLWADGFGQPPVQ